jgi:hypothetical protein
MKSLIRSRIAILALLFLSPVASVNASEDDDSVQMCLKAWGKHPFGSNPSYKTLTSNVKVFGIGQNIEDVTDTETNELVLVDTGVNVLGSATMRLLNPKGWYCFKSNINVMGGLTIQGNCKAHFASATNGMSFLGRDQSNKSTTVLGSTYFEPMGCKPAQ